MCLGRDELGRIEKYDAPLGLHGNSRIARRHRAQLFQCFDQSRSAFLSGASYGNVEGLVHSLGCEGLEHIVDCALLERLDGILLMGGNEDYGGHEFAPVAQSLDKLQPRHLGHVDVEEQHIEALLL